METAYYFALFSDTFLWTNETQGIIYNSEKHICFSFDLNDLVKEYCSRLNDSKNLYVVDISQQDWENQDLKNWIEHIVENKMGDLIEYTTVGTRPISFPPLLNLQSDVDRISKEKGRSIGEYVAYNWNELSIFLGSKSEFPNYYLQFPYPVASECILNIDDFNSFLLTADNSYLVQINIIGDILDYPYKSKFIQLLDSLSAKLCFYQIGNCLEKIVELTNFLLLNKNKYNLKLYYVNQISFDEINKHLTMSGILFSWLYIIADKSDMEKLETIQLNNPKIQLLPCPIFTGDNLDFFKECIYISQDDIINCHYDKQDVFAHQVMNSNYWGRLSILPNGNVYSCLNNIPLGTLNNPIYDLLVKEMEGHSAWRLTRDIVPECKICLYRYLCPPPSDYGFTIGKFSLCHLR